MPKPIEAETLAEIERRCAAATAGPWKSFVEGRDHESGSSFIRTGGEDIYLSGATVADQDFVAHARQDVPLLLAELRVSHAPLGRGSQVVNEAEQLSPQVVLTSWLGHSCDEVVRREYDWDFRFGGAGGVVAECPWRIIADGRIALADADHGQLFGLREPIDGSVRARALLSGGAITSVQITPVTGDLQVHFAGGVTLELLNGSSGYEGWHATAIIGVKSISVVAQGGGSVVVRDE